MDYGRTNAAVGWLVLLVLVTASVGHVRSGTLLWALMGVAIVAVALVPVAMRRRLGALPAWEVLALAAGPVVVRSLGHGPNSLAYLAVAAVALVVAVELDAFTQVEMTPSFAVGFVVIITMAVAGLWTIAQFTSDTYLGTSMLVSQAEAMRDLIVATATGLLSGVVFELYVRRRSPGHALAEHSASDAQ